MRGDVCCWSWVIYSPRKTWIILDSFIVYGVSISSTCLICLSLPVLHTAGLCWPQHGGVCRFRLHRALLYPGGLRHQEHSAGQLHSEGAYENPMKKAKLVQLWCLRLNEGHFYIYVYILISSYMWKSPWLPFFSTITALFLHAQWLTVGNVRLNQPTRS